ncbi:MAG: hypothetical protein NWE87_06930 [Candidatus Bathyarchaeota archaeon]|nr:hypothetical protein [Candidatus Bathyarchaeota archaeon]
MGRRGWWRRSLGQYFRVLEGEQHKIRDVQELQENWKLGSSTLSDEINSYRSQFQQGVEKYRARSGRRMLLKQYLDAEAKEEGVVETSKRFKLKTFRKWEEE